MTAWLTTDEVASYAKVNVVTLRRAMKAGTLIGYRVNGGRNVRFLQEDIDRWLMSAPTEVCRG